MLMSREPKGPNIQHVAGRREVQGFVIKGIERERATDRPTERRDDAPVVGAWSTRAGGRPALMVTLTTTVSTDKSRRAAGEGTRVSRMAF